MFSLELIDDIALRLIEERHSEELFSLVQANYPRLLHWCPWLGEVETIEKTRHFIQGKLQRFADGNGFTAGFFDSDRLFGVIALESIDKANLTTEIGYWLDSEAEGRGLVITACRKLIDYAFHKLRLERVQIRCASENFRSRSIPYKLGFKLEGTMRQAERLRDRFVDLEIYGMLANEWKPI